MDVDEFTEEALKLSGLRGVRQRDRYFKKLDILTGTIDDVLSEVEVGQGSSLHNLHLWLWTKNKTRFPSSYTDAEVSMYSSIAHIIDKEITSEKKPIGICAGLVAEYVVLADRLGIPVKPVHLQGISDSHVYLQSLEHVIPQYVNTVHRSGYNCDVEFEAAERSRIISNEQLLALLMNNFALTESHYGNYSGALRKIQQALQIYEDAPEIQFNKAFIQLKQGHVDQAERSLNKLSQQYRSASRVAFMEGEIALARNEYETAAHIFHDVARQGDDQRLSAIRNIGISLDRMGYTGEAIHFLKEALDLNPEDGKARREFYKAMRSP
jgi:hypothetical protein